MPDNLVHTRLVSRSVATIRRGDDHWNLEFTGGWTLTVWNPVAISCSPDVGAPAATHDLVGASVSAIDETDAEIRFFFSNGCCLTIDLRDEAYAGPEAFLLASPQGEIVVGTGEGKGR